MDNSKKLSTGFAKVLSGPAKWIRAGYQNTSGKVFSKVLPFERNGGPDRTFAKPVESFFELSIIAAPSFHEGRGNEPK